MRIRMWGVVVTVLLLFVPRIASAQERGGGDFAVGYNALYLFGEGGGPGLTMPTGFFVSGAARVGRRGGVMLVGEVADSTKTVSDVGGSATASILTFAGGIRIMGDGGGRGPREGARPFVEILIGGAHSNSLLSDAFPGDALAVMPGAGVDVPVGRRTAVRLAGKFELFQNGATDHAFRFDVGIAFHTGRR